MRRNPFVFLLLAACNGDARGACDLGFLVPESPDYEALAREIRHAAALVSDSLRRTNSPITLSEINTSGDPALAATRVPSTMQARNMPLVVGSLISSETHQFARRVVVDLGRVVLANGSSDPSFTTLDWRRDGDGFFRNWPPDDAEATAMAEYVLSRGYRRLVVMHAQDRYSEALTRAFVRTFTGAGGTLAQQVRSYVPNAPDLSRILAPLNGQQFDALYVVGLPRDLGQLYRGLRTGAAGERHRAKHFFTGVAVEGADFRSEVATVTLTSLVYSAPELDKTSSAYRLFAAQYRSAFNSEPDIFSTVAYDALWLAAISVRFGRACSADSARAFLHNMPSAFDGASGATQFTARGDVLTKKVSIRALTDRGSELLESRDPAQR